MVADVVVDVSFDTVGGLCTVAFLEAADRRIGRQHLFKRSILLVSVGQRCRAGEGCWLRMQRFSGHRMRRVCMSGMAKGSPLQMMRTPLHCHHCHALQPLLAPASPAPTAPAHPLQLKAWCYYESRLLGAHHGLISSYALEVRPAGRLGVMQPPACWNRCNTHDLNLCRLLFFCCTHVYALLTATCIAIFCSLQVLVLYIFNQYHAELHTPLDVSWGAAASATLAAACCGLLCHSRLLHRPSPASRGTPCQVPLVHTNSLPLVPLPTAGAAPLPVGAGLL